MPNDCQQSIDKLWDKYRLALQRLDWALDQLNKQVPNNVVAESDPNEVSIDDFVIGELYNTEGLPASSFRTDDWEIK